MSIIGMRVKSVGWIRSGLGNLVGCHLIRYDTGERAVAGSIKGGEHQKAMVNWITASSAGL